jgi:hypothetical protein
MLPAQEDDQAGVTYDELSDELQRTIAKLEVAVEELQAEAKFYFWASLIVVALVLERIWDRLVG